MRMRTRAALAAGKATGAASRLSRAGGGTTLPGRIARRLDGGFVRSMAGGLPGGCALVTGTNGKTTTSTLLASILEAAGIHPVHNRTGANLMAGIASSMILESDLSGRLPGSIGLFEVDEAALPYAIEETRPRLVLVNNLFRDQLDRYGELDTLASRMKGAIETLDREATVVLNADDPLVASIGRGLEQEVMYFGIDSEAYASTSMQHAADSKHCPVCGSRLDYRYYIFGHLGRYNCPSCGADRPEAAVAATEIKLDGMDGTRCEVRYPGGSMELYVPIPGLYNVYNVLAATSCALSLGAGIDEVSRTVHGFTAAFGRVERVRAGDRNVMMILAKNPAGYNEVIRALSSDESRKDVLLALNDNIADGRDVSWIWDIDLEMFHGRVAAVTCSGIRATDMALRVKYAEIAESSLTAEPDLEKAFDSALAALPPEGTLYVVPTYTAMLDLRGMLADRGLVSPYWED